MDRRPGLSVRLRLTLSYAGFLILAGALLLTAVLAFLLVFGLVGGWILAGRMLARLEAHVAEQRRFAANASHELRTPLAITQTLLDVARNDPYLDTGELVGRLHAVNTRAIDPTEALLLLSRADQRSFTREAVDAPMFVKLQRSTCLLYTSDAADE